MAIKNAIQFLREVRSEMKKVVWPKPDEWIGSTIIVLVLVTFFMIYLGALDFAFKKLFGYIFKQATGY